MYVTQVQIDHNKCVTPYACKLCLRVCPEAVFVVKAVKVQKFKETDPHEPGAWKLYTNYADKCTGCKDCVEICPSNAIALFYGSEGDSHEE